MKKQQFFKKAGLIALIAVMGSFGQAQAADLADASGILADIAVMAVQAKANLAVAANSGDVDAIAEAVKRADAVDAAMSEALAAYNALETATEENDDDAAEEAFADMETARQKANDALNGAVPEATPASMHSLWKESQKNTGGGPGRSYDPPNIYDRPWHSQGLRHFYQGVFGTAWSASANGGSHVFGDRDATPE